MNRHIDLYRDAIKELPTRNMRYALFVRNDDDDFAIKDRTLYLPLMSAFAVDTLLADQLVFYKALDSVMNEPFDMILAWHNSLLVSYRPRRLYHPRYIATYRLKPAKACRWLRCEPATLMEYYLWTTEGNSKKGYYTVAEMENIEEYAEILSDYVHKLSQKNDEDEEEEDDRF